MSGGGGGGQSPLDLLIQLTKALDNVAKNTGDSNFAFAADLMEDASVNLANNNIRAAVAGTETVTQILNKIVEVSPDLDLKQAVQKVLPVLNDIRRSLEPLGSFDAPMKQDGMENETVNEAMRVVEDVSRVTGDRVLSSTVDVLALLNYNLQRGQTNEAVFISEQLAQVLNDHATETKNVQVKEAAETVIRAVDSAVQNIERSRKVKFVRSKKTAMLLKEAKAMKRAVEQVQRRTETAKQMSELIELETEKMVERQVEMEEARRERNRLAEESRQAEVVSKIKKEKEKNLLMAKKKTEQAAQLEIETQKVKEAEKLAILKMLRQPGLDEISRQLNKYKARPKSNKTRR